MNSATQKYRLNFFNGDVETTVEATGDNLIAAIGQVPDGVKIVRIVDLNLLELPPEHASYFFYYLPLTRAFAHMIDVGLFPKSKEASDWWNDHIGGKLTWDEPQAENASFRVELVNVQTIGARCGYGVGATLEEAQADALRQAKERDPEAKLSENGYQVHFAGGVNC
jgi:hypothetical protein